MQVAGMNSCIKSNPYNIFFIIPEGLQELWIGIRKVPVAVYTHHIVGLGIKDARQVFLFPQQVVPRRLKGRIVLFIGAQQGIYHQENKTDEGYDERYEFTGIDSR